jgi:hypothetical protein
VKPGYTMPRMQVWQNPPGRQEADSPVRVGGQLAAVVMPSRPAPVSGCRLSFALEIRFYVAA